MTASARKRWILLAVWWIVGIAWIAAWPTYLFASGPIKADAAVVLVIGMVLVALLKWRDRGDARSKGE